MKTKIIITVGIAIILMGIFTGIILEGLSPSEKSNIDLEEISGEVVKYRDSGIPEECKLPEYENSVENWKEHLSHHKNTWYCLEEFYNTSIEEMS